ncbi:hypothetical protein CASFOL_025720 [Castilleja foliolosa]|uniref:Uncharacterized protein n=1 Tax=Castilleja foliolosa TaxID=1961234 RepID=A0ABD3CRX9_9LAMI
MDANSWAAPLSYASKRYQSALQSRSEMLMGFEEIEMDEDTHDEYPCPYCSEYFDIMGLCCHIDDEHPAEAGNGVCPVCTTRVGVDMVAHITLQHRNIFKLIYVQPKRKSRKLGSHSTLSLLRKELRERNLRSIFGGSSRVVPLSNAAPDPLLSSFILPRVEDYYEDVQSDELFKKSTTDIISDRKVRQPPMSVEDQEEKTKRCDFVRELLWSTILDDNL